MNKEELLQFALDNDMLDMDKLQFQAEMRIKEQFLSKHPYKIWQGINGLWYTYVPDFKKGRVLKKRRNYEDIVQVVVEYQKENDNNITITTIFNNAIDTKLQNREIQIQTADRYRYDFNKYIKDSMLDNIPFRAINEILLEDYIKYTIAKFNMTNKMWNNLSIIIKTVFKRAKKMGHTTLSINSFFSDLELSKKSFRGNYKMDREEVFTQEEENIIINYLETCTDLNSLGILLMFQTGIRVGELVALEFSDIKPNYMEINKTEIHYDKDNGNKKKRVYEIRDYPKTPAGIRRVYFTDATYELIKKIRTLHSWEPYLFMKKGRRITENCIYMRLIRVCDKLGIPRRSPHKIRKTYATTLFDNHISPKTIISQLGHTDIRTSQKYYYFNRSTPEETVQALQTVFNNKGNQR